MKSNFFLAAIAAVSLLAASCSKENKEVQTFKASAEQATDNTKISLSGLSLRWSAGDQISVYDNSSNAGVYALSSGAGTNNGEFAYSSGSSVSAAPFSAVYPAAIRTGAATVSLPAVQHSADGGLQELPMYAVDDDMELKFHHLCGVVRFRLRASSAVSVSRIAVATDRNTNGAATISGSGSSATLSTPNGSNVTTLSCEYGQSISSAHDFYMYLPAGTYSSFRILLTAADGSICSKSANTGITLERGKITTITLTGLSFTAHRFSTSNSTSVVFSPGNLQYMGSAATPYWRFADRQYDYFDTTTGQNSTAVDVDRDLFGWGTSGWNNGNYWYQPYSTNNYVGEPYTFQRGEGYGPTNGSSYTYNLTDTYAQADWGVHNPVRNGGNVVGQWHTLTQSEWNYIFFDRSVGMRYAKGTIAGKAGVIVLPDGYIHPTELVSLANANTVDAAFTANQYTGAEWLRMEAAGALFLPAAGHRNGTRLNVVGTNGYYWSSTCDWPNSAYTAYFKATDLCVDDGESNCAIYKSLGQSVRLVRD